MDRSWSPYCGPAPLPDEVLGRWNADPMLLGVLLALFCVGMWRVKQTDRGVFGGAMLVLAIGFISPLCALSSALFTARTLHHLLLVLAAAPLLALCLPLLKKPRLMAATAVQALVFWSWHAPSLYAQALSHDGVYWLMQISILASSVWFWAAVRSVSAHAAIVGLLAAMLLMGLLGALIVFAGQPLYAPHFASGAAWGLGPLEDQQAAGLIMWAPAAAAYLLVALLKMRALLQPARRAQA